MPAEIIKSQFANIPETSGVYQFFDINDQVLYIGKAKNLKKRLQNYTQPQRLSRRIERMVFLAQKLEFTQTETELEALLLEHNLIKKFAPKYNILLRDDKTFPHILLSKHRFPQISKHRGSKKDQGEYFGPFAAAGDVNKTIDILKKSFLLRGCSDSEFKSRTKPCLEYQIKRCSGPCANLITEDDYEKLVQNACDFLRGKSMVVQEELAKKMQKFSENYDYEKAASVRDRIKSLASIQSKQNINIAELGDADVITLVTKSNRLCIYISFFRGGNNYGSKPYFYEIDEDFSSTVISTSSSVISSASEKSLESEQDLKRSLTGVRDDIVMVRDDSVDKKLGEFLSEFLGQFYLSQLPPESILLNIEIDEKDLMESFLNNLSNKKTTIKIPKQGDRLKLIKDHEQLAMQSLEQKLAQNLSNQERLLELKNLFDLAEMPKRIEVYDNSHISGEYAVGVFITAGAEGFIKNGYRKFNIRFDEIKNRDDTAMLQEVLRRRFKENSKDAFPDLIIIDGGLGQLSAAQRVFNELKINPRCVCMSKGEDRNAGEEFFHQIKFPTPLPPLPKEEGKTCFASDACDAMSGSSKVDGKVHSEFPTPLPPLPKEEGKTCFASDACDAMSGSSKVAGKVHSEFPTPLPPLPKEEGKTCFASDACDAMSGSSKVAGKVHSEFPTPLPPLPKEEGKTCFASDACDAMSGSSKVAGKVHSFTLPKTHKIMYYLQQLRDEAHRFAITTHRNKRAKSVTKSSLDDIDGIGKNRKKALLNHFGSLDKIKSATVEDLIRLDGINKAIAEKIRDFLN